MSPEQKRKFNTVFGGVFLGGGIVAWALTVYFAMTPNPPRPTPVVGMPTIDLSSCRSVLAGFGYDAKVKDSDVIAYEPLSASPKDQLQKATLAATVCKLPMKSFCMGEGCAQPGLTVVVGTTGAVDRKARVAAAAAASTPTAPKDGAEKK
jgi:hypothetical protein